MSKNLRHEQRASKPATKRPAVAVNRQVNAAGFATTAAERLAKLHEAGELRGHVAALARICASALEALRYQDGKGLDELAEAADRILGPSRDARRLAAEEEGIYGNVLLCLRSEPAADDVRLAEVARLAFALDHDDEPADWPRVPAAPLIEARAVQLLSAKRTIAIVRKCRSSQKYDALRTIEARARWLTGALVGALGGNAQTVRRRKK